MTRKEVKSHELAAAISVVSEMGLNKNSSSSQGPVSIIELSVSCRYNRLSLFTFFSMK